MTKEDYKKAIIAIFVGAVTAFVTVFLEGILEFLQGMGNNVVGGMTATAFYALKSVK